MFKNVALGVAVIGLAALGSFAHATPARADEDHGRAREAVMRGDVAPLAKALEALEKSYPGDVLEVELEEEGHSSGNRYYVYEIKIINAEGKVMEVEMDAKTLEILEVEGAD